MKNLKKRILSISAVLILIILFLPVSEVFAQHKAPGGDFIQDINSGDLNGLVLNIVYTRDRYSDAMGVADILRRNGITVKLTNTGERGNEKYDGKILYKQGFYDSAVKIAGLINGYEKVIPQEGTPKFYKDKQFNLWITTRKNIFVDNLSGLVANIVYTQERYADALSVGSLLRRRGVQIRYTKTTSGKSYQGKVLYRNGFYNQAKEIAGIVKKYELVRPQLGKPQFYKDKHFNLWITAPKFNQNYTNLSNLIVNIVYTQQRFSDALNVGKMLRQRGMIIRYTKTTSGNSFAGKILYRQGYNRTASYIAGLIRNIERVRPQFGTQSGYKDKHFNLWITSFKNPANKSFNDYTNLNGLVVNIVYTQQRYADALDVGRMLRQRGMIVKYTKTTSGNSFAGKILYRRGYDRTARYISDMIRGFEMVSPQYGTQSGYKDKHFNLWITR